MKHITLIRQMTLEEKAAFLTGKSVWETRGYPRHGIPSRFLADGPHGVRKQAGAADHLGLNASIEATCFPSESTIANSWDEQLAEEVGAALGAEAAALDVDVLLGPGLNIKRSPLGGRNFEYFSEDPLLSGKMSAAYVRGIQSKGVAACPKHFAANSQELHRMSCDSVADERTLREIYLTGFEITVQESAPRSIMSSYNLINGTYAHENPWLLKEVLRGEWGFDGAVITDWGGSNSCVSAVQNGGTLEMPSTGGDSCRQIMAAIRSGMLSESDLDQRVDELLELLLPEAEGNVRTPMSELREKHHTLARRAAAESIVLLKNEDDILPLRSDAKVAVIGSFAFTPRYQGAGSSMVNTVRVDAPVDAVKDSGIRVIGSCEGFKRDGSEDQVLLDEALNLAKQSDIVLLYLGIGEMDEVEGVDRAHLKIAQNQIDLLASIASVNSNVVILFSGGAAVETEWARHCKALALCGLGGQAGAGAAADILTGKECPGGRLAESYPMRLEDTPAFCCYPGRERTAEYREGIFVGYRYYETSGVSAAYPFGFGLSYTQFAYSDLLLNDKEASFTVKNIGDCDGAEVAQLYVSCKSGAVYRPAKELKGFAKVHLKAGESRRITIGLNEKTFRYYNTAAGRWETEEAEYTVRIGSNVRDIRLTGSLTVEGVCVGAQAERFRTELPSYYSGSIQHVGDEEFQRLLGRRLPAANWERTLGRNDTLGQMGYAKSRLARLVHRILLHIKDRREAQGTPDLNIVFQLNMPFRAIAKMTGGLVSMDMVDGIVLLVNGSLIKGFGQIISGFFHNRRENAAMEKRLAECVYTTEGEEAK